MRGGALTHSRTQLLTREKNAHSHKQSDKNGHAHFPRSQSCLNTHIRMYTCVRKCSMLITHIDFLLREFTHAGIMPMSPPPPPHASAPGRAPRDGRENRGGPRRRRLTFAPVISGAVPPRRHNHKSIRPKKNNIKFRWWWREIVKNKDLLYRLRISQTIQRTRNGGDDENSGEREILGGFTHKPMYTRTHTLARASAYMFVGVCLFLDTCTK